MIDWNDRYHHRCEFCRHCGPTTTTNSGDGPIHKCWCQLDGIPGPLHDLYGEACDRWVRTTRFDEEEDDNQRNEQCKEIARLKAERWTVKEADK